MRIILEAFQKEAFGIEIFALVTTKFWIGLQDIRESCLVAKWKSKRNLCNITHEKQIEPFHDIKS